MLLLPSFEKVVRKLSIAGKTVSVVESTCGGLINASIMSVPGSSRVYVGGTVAYNTRKAKKLLLDDEALHASLLSSSYRRSIEEYVDSKKHWTAATSSAYRSSLGTDYAVSEAGAAGPTFNVPGLESGFTVISVSNRSGLVAQRVVWSTDNDREGNMRMFTSAAADLLAEAVEGDAEIDRATKSRGDLHHGDKVYVLVGDRNRISLDGNRLARMPSLPKSQGLEETFLGLVDGQAVYSVDVGSDTAGFVDARTHAPMLNDVDRRLAMHAVAMMNWQRNSNFCPKCGGRAPLLKAGSMRRCDDCSAVHFPRQDPSIIVVVSSRCGSKVLLGRSPRHPRLVHTALAGFVEAGESFEDATAREVFEETGVRLDRESIKYVGSQPWPFPQSSMVAFRATADHALPLDVDTDELEAARWFDRDDVEKAAGINAAVMDPVVAAQVISEHPDLECLVPPRGVIARTLIETYLKETSSSSSSSDS